LAQAQDGINSLRALSLHKLVLHIGTYELRPYLLGEVNFVEVLDTRPSLRPDGLFIQDITVALSPVTMVRGV